MWQKSESLDSLDISKDKPKISFEELVRGFLTDGKIDSGEASGILDRFYKDQDDIMNNSKQALSDLKSNLNIANGDIDTLVNTLTSIRSSGQISKNKLDFIRDLFDKKQFNSFAEINEEIKRQNLWTGLYEIMNTDNILSNAWITPEAFEQNYRNYISIISAWISAWSFSLYAAFAEEANFEYKDGKYEINGFKWMNIPHRIALNKFNSMFTNVSLDSLWNIVWWVVNIKLDLWEKQSAIDLQINFDNNTITPEIFSSSFIWPQKIEIDHIKDFIHLYTKVQPWYEHPLFIKNWDKFEISQWINPDALNILNTSFDMGLLAHEWQHALYSADSQYRELIHDRVRTSTDQQKRAALLAASINYDIFDPSMSEVNKWIVIDEMFNAYYNAWSYDYKTMISKVSSFSLGALSKRYSLNFDSILESYSKIDDLPIAESIKEWYKEQNKEWNNGGDEKEFIKKQKDAILDNIW